MSLSLFSNPTNIIVINVQINDTIIFTVVIPKFVDIIWCRIHGIRLLMISTMKQGTKTILINPLIGIWVLLLTKLMRIICNITIIAKYTHEQ